MDLLDRGDQIEQEADRVIIAIVQRKPPKGFARLARSNPFTDDGGLPKTGRRADQGNALSALISILENLNQSWTPDQAGLDGWDV